MGQYHNVINMDKKMQYSPSSLANGLKLLEQGQSLTSTAALALLLSEGWNGERVFLLGDYVEEGDLNGIENACALAAESDKYRNVGWLARKVVTENIGVTFQKESYKVSGFGSVSEHHYYETTLPDNMNIDDVDGKFVAYGEAFDGIDNNEVVAFVNYDKQEKYIGNSRTLRQVVQHFDGDFMTAAFVLIAGSIKGGARGGGDAHNELGGAWAGDRVGIVPAKDVENFTDITADLGEIPR